MIDISNLFDNTSLLSLIRRCELVTPLLRRQIEEEIIDIVPISDDQISAEEISLIGQESRDSWLKDRGFDDDDLKINATRILALQAFARQRFGPGIEESFLASRGGRDEIVYSLLRVKDNGLARELYIRLVEGEIAFPDAARHYGEGPEARHQGVIGPLRLDRLQPPELADSLRSLQPGEISRPLKLGVWHLILRLEHFLPAKLDQNTIDSMLQEQLNAFLSDRVARLMAGERLDKLTFDSDVPHGITMTNDKDSQET